MHRVRRLGDNFWPTLFFLRWQMQTLLMEVYLRWEDLSRHVLLRRKKMRQ